MGTWRNEGGLAGTGFVKFLVMRLRGWWPWLRAQASVGTYPGAGEPGALERFRDCAHDNAPLGRAIMGHPGWVGLVLLLGAVLGAAAQEEKQQSYYEFGTVFAVGQRSVQLRVYDPQKYTVVQHSFLLSKETRADLVRGGRRRRGNLYERGRGVYGAANPADGRGAEGGGAGCGRRDEGGGCELGEAR